MAWLDYLISFWSELLGGVFPNAIRNPLSVATFLGILISISLGYSSLNHQRRNAARESLEQLDDLSIRGDIKIKAILHEFPRWPLRHVTVKLKILNQHNTAGISNPNNQFYIIPACIMMNYDFETVPDGYIIHLQTTNPVKIRNSIEDIYDDIYEIPRRNYQVPYGEYMKHYSNAHYGEWDPIYNEILEELTYFSTIHKNKIFQNVGNYHRSLIDCALTDLDKRGLIEEDSSRFFLTSDWKESFSFLF
jgi:hypothetical protein